MATRYAGRFPCPSFPDEIWIARWRSSSQSAPTDCAANGHPGAHSFAG